MVSVPAGARVELQEPKPAVKEFTVHRNVLPVVKVTVPVGVPAPEVTVTLYVTDWPNVLVVGRVVTAVVVGWLLFTVSDAALLVLVLKLVSPLYVAEMESVWELKGVALNGELFVKQDPLPPDRVATQSTPPGSEPGGVETNVTVPVGVLPGPLTIPVYVTSAPAVEGDGFTTGVTDEFAFATVME
jgi:hypothetical protein